MTLNYSKELHFGGRDRVCVSLNGVAIFGTVLDFADGSWSRDEGLGWFIAGAAWGLFEDGVDSSEDGPEEINSANLLVKADVAELPSIRLPLVVTVTLEEPLDEHAQPRRDQVGRSGSFELLAIVGSKVEAGVHFFYLHLPRPDEGPVAAPR